MYEEREMICLLFEYCLTLLINIPHYETFITNGLFLTSIYTALAQTTTGDVIINEPPLINRVIGNGAIANYDKVIAADPKNSMAYCNRGIAKMTARRYGDAIADLA